MRENGLKLQQRTFKCDIKKNITTQRFTKHWNRLPREEVETSSLEVFKSCVTWHLGTRYSGGLGSVRSMVGLDNLKRLFQPK